MSALENVQQRMRDAGVKRVSGDEWLCPTHDDKGASLTIKAGEGVPVLVKCGAGCDTEDVLAYAGLSMADLFDDGKVPRGEYVGTEHYVYEDENKTPLYRVVRRQYEHGKTFTQERADGQRWRKSLNGIEPVLFRLPQVLRAARKGKTIHVVEGEKDVLRLKAAGVVATTKPGGAGGKAWTEGYTETLRGAAEVVIWADRDVPGYKAARATATALSAAGLAVRVVLPIPDHPHADATDHLNAGHTVEDVKWVTLDELDSLIGESVAVVEDAKFTQDLEHERRRLRVRETIREEQADAEFVRPQSDASLRESLAKPRPPLPYTIDRLHPTGSSALIAASYKVGKTMLMMNLTRSYADGERFLGYFKMHPGSGRIAYWNFELPEDMFLDYIAPLGIVNPDRIVPLHLRGKQFDLRSPAAFKWAVGWLRGKGCDALVADPLANFARLTNENDNAEAARFLSDYADRLKDAAGLKDLWIPAHTGRGAAEEGDEHVRGASSVDGWADVRWNYTKQFITRDDGVVVAPRYLSAFGRRVEVGEHTVEFDAETSDLIITERQSRAQARHESHAQRVLAIVTAGPGINSTALGGRLGIGNRDKPTVIKQALDQGLIRVEYGARNSKNYYPAERVER